ncbi:hypothetical protein [Longimicrobium sp.]|uniref:hypothetical protein n=1 Tax=Longimicrobium sp. TaxID=2029185 RepID=UPI002EDAE938
MVETDDWYDTLRIRGKALSTQVLVEWERGENPVRLWELLSDLDFPADTKS